MTEHIETPPPRRQADSSTFKALAHPLRVRIFNALAARPSTATALAEALGESSGSTSYHLRQLARHGLIEEDRALGNARERWWRIPPGGVSFDPAVMWEDVDASRTLLESTLTEWHLDARRALARVFSAPEPTLGVDLIGFSRYALRGTPEELKELFDHVEDLLQPFLASVRAEEPGVATISAQLITYPEA